MKSSLLLYVQFQFLVCLCSLQDASVDENAQIFFSIFLVDFLVSKSICNTAFTQYMYQPCISNPQIEQPTAVTSIISTLYGHEFLHDIALPPEIVSTLFGIAQRPFSSLFCTGHASSAFSQRSNTVSGKGLSWRHWDVYSWVWCHPTRDMSAMVPKVICCQHTTIPLVISLTTIRAVQNKTGASFPLLKTQPFFQGNLSVPTAVHCPSPKAAQLFFIEFLGRISFLDILLISSTKCASIN